MIAPVSASKWLLWGMQVILNDHPKYQDDEDGCFERALVLRCFQFVPQPLPQGKLLAVFNDSNNFRGDATVVAFLLFSGSRLPDPVSDLLRTRAVVLERASRQ